MTWISNPFVYYICVGCKRKLDLAIGPNKVADELSRLRNGPPLYCACCDPGAAIPGCFFAADGGQHYPSKPVLWRRVKPKTKPQADK